MYSGWNGLSWTQCKALGALFDDKRYISALFNLILIQSIHPSSQDNVHILLSTIICCCSRAQSSEKILL